MTASSEQAIILEHALESENNLKVTLDITWAYEHLRPRIPGTFAGAFS